jgi:cyclophilin family peptidyl-prolyl cis-trans isomerase
MTPRLVTICSLLLVFIVFIAGAGSVFAQSAAPITVDLELNQHFFYEGDPLHMRVSVRNNSDAEVSNPIKIKLFKGFNARTVEGRELTLAASAGLTHPKKLESMTPLSFYGGIVDITAIFSELKQIGTYEISWAANGLESNSIVLQVIPRYDPAKRYGAILSTSAGEIELALFADESPITAKAFIDMANSGFYDGLKVTELHSDAYIVAGDGRTGNPPRVGFQYPAEQSTLRLVAGTVIMKPTGAAPPANGSEFMILLRPIPTWAGQVTVLGQVVKGLKVVQELSNLPNHGQTRRPHFKPLKEIEIIKVTITGAAAPKTAGG